MRILATICARGGSKGVKNKNLRLLNRKPLISYSIEAIKAWNKADRIICSTDSDEIRNIASEYGAETPFSRPNELATDNAGKLNVLKHAVRFCEKDKNIKYDYILDLDPTSPLRTIKNIEDSMNNFMNSNADLLISVYRSHKNPYFNMVELNKKGYAYLCKTPEQKVVARQQAPIVYSVNSSIYIYRRDFLMKTKKILSDRVIVYEMPDYAIDIDREIDLQFIEFLLKKEIFKFDY